MNHSAFGSVSFGRANLLDETNPFRRTNMDNLLVGVPHVMAPTRGASFFHSSNPLAFNNVSGGNEKEPKNLNKGTTGARREKQSARSDLSVFRPLNENHV
jgi:hypothetical protein